MSRSGRLAAAAAGVFCAAIFLMLTVPHVPAGPVTGTGQDEWYNMIRGLRALYERFNPSYFIHPALYYELLAVLYGTDRVMLAITGNFAAGTGFLDYVLAHQEQFLELARHASIACGALAVLAAVWLGTMLSSPIGGLLAGMLVATLPLLQTMAVCIRVDTLGLGAFMAAAALVVRRSRCSDQRSLLLASLGIGIAAAANYPGALLLIVLGWFEWMRADGTDSQQRRRRFAGACAAAFATFLVFDPYVVIDMPHFLEWFFFLAKVPVVTHPHGPEPSAWRYLDLLRDQGALAVLACLAGVTAMMRPREAAGTMGTFGLVYLVTFSALRTQYDRFALPAIALLCVAGAAWMCAQLARWLSPWAARAFAFGVVLLILWQPAPLRPRTADIKDPEPDYRAEMFAWITANVPSTATLLLESDTLPLVQTVYDPGAQGRPFQIALQAAFERLHPSFPKKIVKAQFIAAVYNYDPKLLEGGEVFFLGSSQNRDYIAEYRSELPEPAAFYEALDARATIAHEAAGFHERLMLYSTARPEPKATS